MPTVAQLLPLLDKGYEAKCLELEIIQRRRKIETPADLMLLCLFHLINGCSLVDISEIARLSNIADISDVAFMKKFALCGEWFEWITSQIVMRELANYSKPPFLNAYRIVAVDASDVVEKGRSGEAFRLHYAIDIFSMQSCSYKITTQAIGESLTNFVFAKGDLVMGDRMYGSIKSIEHCLAYGAEYLLRLRTNCFNIYDINGNKITMSSVVKDLKYEEEMEFTGYIHRAGKEALPVRVCVRRKDKEACEKSKKVVSRKESKKQRTYSDEAKLLNEYIIIATSLPESISKESVLQTYRYRWQIENLFKRLKSIMDFGELPKKNEASSLSWLKGKLMVALLMETMISGSFFSPCSDFEEGPEFVEGV
jgi:hypothetical protein